jgi:hypothetical protein
MADDRRPHEASPHAGPGPHDVAEALARLRVMFDADGLGPASLAGAFWLDLIASPRGANDGGESYELLAYDALARARPEWACICLRAAAAAYEAAGQPEEQAAATARAERVRAERFPAYASEGERLAEVAAWARARLAEWLRLTDERAAAELRGDADLFEGAGALANPVVARRLRWFFRQQASVDQGVVLPLDRVASTLGLDSRDRLLLVFLAAVERDAVFQSLVRGSLGREASAALLVSLLADEEAAHAPLLARFDVRAPLTRFGLVQLVPPPGREHAPLNDCGISLDDCVRAAAERRDHWPPLLADVASPLEAVSESELRLHRGATTAIRAAVSAAGVTSVVLRSTTARSSRAAARAFASGSGRPLVEFRVADATTARLAPQMAALAREVRLRGAVVFVDQGPSPNREAQAAIVVELDRVGALCASPPIFHAPPYGDDGLLRSLENPVEISLFGLTPQARRAHWNEALHAHDLPRLVDAPELVDLPLDPAAIAHVVALVATQAKLTTPSGRRANAPPAALLAMALRLYP